MKKQNKITVIAIFIMVSLLVTGCALGQKTDTKKSVDAGTWIQSQKVAEADNKAHDMKYKIDVIIRDQKKVKAAIEEYNLSGKGNVIGELDNDNLEFCMAKYSATYPDTFPQKTFGITDVAVTFEIVSMTGGDIEVDDTVYKNLKTTWEIGDLPQGYDFHAGDTYHGEIVFVMVKDYKDYLIHQVSEDDEDSDQTYIKGE